MVGLSQKRSNTRCSERKRRLILSFSRCQRLSGKMCRTCSAKTCFRGLCSVFVPLQKAHRCLSTFRFALTHSSCKPNLGFSLSPSAMEGCDEELKYHDK